MAKISKLLTSKDRLVRNVEIELAERNKPKKNEIQGKRRTLIRAVQKLCILPSEPPPLLE